MTCRVGSPSSALVMERAVKGRTIGQPLKKPGFDSISFELPQLFASHFLRRYYGARSVHHRVVLVRCVLLGCYSRFLWLYPRDVPACDGNWELLAERVGVLDGSMEGYLEYAAVFLENRKSLRTRRWIHSCRPLYSWRSREEATGSLCSRFSEREYRTNPKRQSNFRANLIRSSSVNRHTTLAFPATLPRVRIIRSTSKWTIMGLITSTKFRVHPENSRLRKKSSKDVPENTFKDLLQADLKEVSKTESASWRKRWPGQ